MSAFALMDDKRQVIVTAPVSQARVTSLAAGVSVAFLLAESLLRGLDETPVCLVGLFTRTRVIPPTFIDFTKRTGLAATAHPTVAHVTLIPPGLLLAPGPSSVAADALA